MAQTDLTPQGNTTALTALCCQIGPEDSAIKHFNATPTQQDILREELSAALNGFETPAGLHVPAEINFFTATIPA